jgi:DNA-directed RNA polymerase subunit RPC12/RpoP
METDILYSCPVCGRKNFLLKGLKAHRCPKKGRRRLTPSGPLEHPPLSTEEVQEAVDMVHQLRPKGFHTLRVRWINGTHQAVDDRTGVKCTHTGGHEQAAYKLLDKQVITGLRLRIARLHQREHKLRDSRKGEHEQWRLYRVLGRCRECGCTDENCTSCIERTGTPCSWVDLDLCSACKG